VCHKVKKYKILKNKQGNIYKLLVIKSSILKSEVYISEVKSGYQKGWNLHKKFKSTIFLIDGSVQFQICKNFMNSKIYKINLELNGNNKIEIPKNTWFAFKSINEKKSAKILNFLHGVHSSKETLKKDINFFRHPLPSK
jgi:hypothetical protein